MPALHELQGAIEALRQALPVPLRQGELTQTGAEVPLWIDEGRLVLGLRSVMRDEGMVIDVREQEVVLGRVDAYPIARWQAYLEGVLRAAPTIVDSLGGLEACLPCELFDYIEVLDDPSLVSADDFAAKLGDREQLERWNQALEQAAWRAQLEPCGLADRVAEVQALLRPSLRLVLDPIEDDAEDDAQEETELGHSRLGGDPDLLPDQPWPEVEGEPMVFVAQFDLAELAEFEAAAELPREGLLSCFYAPFPAEGQSLEHPVALLHSLDRDALERRPSPEPRDRLRPHAIHFEPERVMPALESAFHFEVLRPRAEVAAFYASLAQASLGRGRVEAPPVDPQALARLVVDRSECDFDGPVHRLLGHPSSIQGDPYLDVEMSRQGWEGWDEGSVEALERRERALGWRLLLQVDAYPDDELLLNQDGGYFYFWLPADALAKHEWSRARGCLQCH